MNSEGRAVELVKGLFATASEENVLLGVWDILTALRGPDNQSEEAKVQGATRIRKELLTQEMASALGVQGYVSWDKLRGVTEATYQTALGRGRHTPQEEHYWRHMVVAMSVILVARSMPSIGDGSGNRNL